MIIFSCVRCCGKLVQNVKETNFHGSKGMREKVTFDLVFKKQVGVLEPENIVKAFDTGMINAEV